jgi:hypothetical protein
MDQWHRRVLMLQQLERAGGLSSWKGVHMVLLQKVTLGESTSEYETTTVFPRRRKRAARLRERCTT